MSDLTEAVAAGMDAAEAEAWVKVAEAARACLRLARRPGAHPMAREEVCHDFHHIQDWLLGLPTYRRLNAPRQEPRRDAQPPGVSDPTEETTTPSGDKNPSEPAGQT